MPWMEIKLTPSSEWSDAGLEDWAQALGAFLTDRGTRLIPQVRMLPGFYILPLGEVGRGELTLSSAERLVILDGLRLKGTEECDFARFVVRFALQMGAVGVCAFITSTMERNFWRKLGGVLRPDPIPLEGSICREKMAIRLLANDCMLVMYAGEPVLCLELILCNAHAPGPVSLAQRRLEKTYGGSPLGFASRLAVHCPWKVSREQWNDLLSFSRLQAFDILAGIERL